MKKDIHETVMIKWKYNNLAHILSERFLSEGFDKKIFEINSIQSKISEIDLFDMAKKEYPFALYIDMGHELWQILQNLFSMKESMDNFKKHIEMIINDNLTYEERKFLPVKSLKSVLYSQKKFILDILKNKKIYCVDEKFSHSNWSRFTSTYFFLFKDFNTLEQFYKRILYVYNKCICFEDLVAINVLHVYLPFGQALLKTSKHVCINPYIDKSYERFFLLNFDMKDLGFKFHFFDSEKEYFKYFTIYEHIVCSGKMKFLPDNDKEFRDNLISSLKKMGWEIMN